MCEGPDLNRRTPARTEFKSVAFDRAWLPSFEVLVERGKVINILRREASNSVRNLAYSQMAKPLDTETLECRTRKTCQFTEQRLRQA